MKNIFTIALVAAAFGVASAQAPAAKQTADKKTATTTAKPATTTAKPAATKAKATKPAATATPAATNTDKAAPAQTADNQGYKFDKTVHDYGTIKKGADPYCTFSLTNTSKEPLIIQSATGSCGCTVPEYQKEPIMPGKTVAIKVRYDTQRVGPFEKQVTVMFQGKDQPAILKIKGVVEAPPAETPFPAPGTTPANGAPVNTGGGF
ncbi:MAG: DUF1573 domain-containing protein [Bacteroidia bacterium]|jgi:hypothetical protein|nr:DUF1573 domain-containing protein [Bacteroidia bacterium]